MRCYYKYVKGVGKVLIPGCMGVVVYDNLDRCTCESKSDYNFDKKEYNQILKAKEEYIKLLESEIKNLQSILYDQQKTT